MLRGPMNRSGKLHALLSTARVANIPSVVSNVWLGVILGLFFGGTKVSDPLWATVGCIALAGVLLYVGGNFLNDWMDREWDRKYRPERALPRGLFPARLYLNLATGLLLGGVGLAATAGGWRCAAVAAGIVGFIVIYTIWHKRSAWTVLPMGICRGLLPVMGFEAFYPYIDGVWPVACALICYIAGLSLSARYESMAEPSRMIGVVARALLLATAVLMAWENKLMALDPLPSLIGAVIYLGWTSFCLRVWRKPVPKLVSGLLAGIPLVDWIVLLPSSVMLFFYSDEDVIVVTAACFLVPPLAFISALLLQRLAPAT